MPKKITEKPPDLLLEDFNSPEKKRVRPNFEEDSSDDDFLIAFHPPTVINQDDPILSGHIQDPIGMTDEDWEETLRMSRKTIPGIQVPSPKPARDRRRKLKNQIQGRKLFKDGQYKTKFQEA